MGWWPAINLWLISNLNEDGCLSERKNIKLLQPLIKPHLSLLFNHENNTRSCLLESFIPLYGNEALRTQHSLTLCMYSNTWQIHEIWPWPWRYEPGSCMRHIVSLRSATAYKINLISSQVAKILRRHKQIRFGIDHLSVTLTLEDMDHLGCKNLCHWCELLCGAATKYRHVLQSYCEDKKCRIEGRTDGLTDVQYHNTIIMTPGFSRGIQIVIIWSRASKTAGRSVLCRYLAQKTDSQTQNC